MDGSDVADKRMDWGKLFTALMFRGTMRKQEIIDSSLPFILAIRRNLHKEYCLNLGIPFEDKENGTPQPQSDSEQDSAAFFGMLNRFIR